MPCTASILTLGVVTGITMTARQPSFLADSATPCAWFPAEAQITPLDRASGDRCAILLYAPRSLKLKTGWSSSRLSRTLLPRRLDRFLAGVSGGSVATPEALAF